MAREDYYSLLGVDKHAPEREIKRAYYNLARDLHPDRAKTPEEARANAEKLAVISKAYNTLKDPQKRTEYDSAAQPRAAGSSAAPDPASGAPPPVAGPVASSPARSKSPAQPQQQQGGAAQPPVQAKVSAGEIASARVLTAQKAFVKGMEYYKAAEFKKAIPFFDAAVANDPDGEPHYHMKLAVCLMRTKGGFTRAVEAAEKAVSMDAYNTEFKLGLGEIYETAGVASKAIAVYEDVLRWEPENQKAMNKLTAIKANESQRNPSGLAKYFPSIFGKK